MRRWLTYLNYRIYFFYKKKNDKTPLFTAYLLTSIFLSINIISVFILTDLLFKTTIIQDFLIKYKYPYIISPFLINYLLVFVNRRYINLFDEFGLYENDYKKWNKSCNLYFGISIALFAVCIYFVNR